MHIIINFYISLDNTKKTKLRRQFAVMISETSWWYIEQLYKSFRRIFRTKDQHEPVKERLRSKQNNQMILKLLSNLAQIAFQLSKQYDYQSLLQIWKFRLI